MIEHVYCINLERSPDRRQTAAAQFARENLQVEFFKATDGRTEAPKGLHITKTEWGCADSHIRIWKDIVEKGYLAALVFEDDIELTPNFISKLENLIPELNEIPEWDFINLGPNDFWRQDGRRVTTNLTTGQALSAHAYIISLKCAQQWSKWDSTKLRVQVDSLMSQYPVNVYHVREPLARPTNVPSTISTFERTWDWQFIGAHWGRALLAIVAIVALAIGLEEQK
jgi:GR25 family glycosyltransferase involved in LPS biosynthesis